MTSRMTLLAMTQNILSAMNSDEVNSISDTTESMQVAEVLRETYYELYANLVEPSKKGLIQLDGLSDPSRPNCLTIPGTCVSIDWVQYNGYQLAWKDPEAFLLSRPYVDGIIQPIGFYAWYADRDPSFYTSFDNKVMVCDSWNRNSDDTLHASKTLAWGQLDFTFKLEDEFVPDLDPNQFPGYLAEAKSVCFVNFKQVSSTKEEARCVVNRSDTKITVGALQKKAMRGRIMGEEEATARYGKYVPQGLLGRIRPNAKYATVNYMEYEVLPDGSLWKIQSPFGGKMHKMIVGRFSTEADAEAQLVRYIRMKEGIHKRGLYPGSLEMEPYVKSRADYIAIYKTGVSKYG